MSEENKLSKLAIERAHDTVIRYPRFKELQRMIRECQELSKIAGEPQCFVFTGVTGSGKSTLIQDIARGYPVVETKDGLQIPFFVLETPSPVTVKGMAAAMLEKLGDPAAHRGSLWSMNFRLRNLMRDCGVEIAILDDFHHLFDPSTDRVLSEVSDWLKWLIKETRIPFGVIGVEEDGEDKVGRILDSNMQLSRLFAWRERLKPFEWNESNVTSIQEFGAFIHKVELITEMQLARELPRMQLLFRIHYATDGVIANIMNLIRYAAMKTEKKGAEIELPMLSLAFRRRIAAQLPQKHNPFDEKWGAAFTPPETPPVNRPNAVSPRSRRRKPNATKP